MPNHYPNLNAEKALIWRIIHRDNLPWILDKGLHCATSEIQAPNYVGIGNVGLIDRRTRRQVPIEPMGTLSDYVPFYFTPFSPMMYNIHTGRSIKHWPNKDIVILVADLRKINQHNLPFVFTDRHAYQQLAQYYNEINNLTEIDWPLLQARNFHRNPDDPEQIERYQAEALIYKHLPIDKLVGIVCYTDELKIELEAQIQQRGLALKVHKMTGWYF